MFSIFIIISNSLLKEICQAPLKKPIPINNKQLLHQILLIRHGHRTPSNIFLPVENRGYWTCDGAGAPAPRQESAPNNRYRYYEQILDPLTAEFPPSCRPGDLTIEGMQQHIELGSLYRDYLVNDLKFLPEKMNPLYFNFISSPLERTFRSAESFINGFYPPLSSNEVLSITCSSEHLSPLYVSSNSCLDFKEMSNNFSKSEEYLNQYQEFWNQISNIGEILGLNYSISNTHLICGWLVALNCTEGSRFPNFITLKNLETCRKEISFSQYDLYLSGKNNGIAGSATMRLILNIIDNALLNINEKKFTLLSSHDTTLSSILVMLGLKFEYVPPYASHLAIEFWKDLNEKVFIRFIYNGDVLNVPNFNDSLIPFDSFRSFIDPKTKFCQEIPI